MRLHFFCQRLLKIHQLVTILPNSCRKFKPHLKFYYLLRELLDQLFVTPKPANKIIPLKTLEKRRHLMSGPCKRPANLVSATF